MTKAILGGGCFWCLEAVFEQLEGVLQVVSGYAGGGVIEPTYDQVCQGDTGHAEVVEITFDPGVIAYRTLLEIFFAIHDPTSLNRQGNDVGTQYRSVVFTYSEEQERAVEAVMEELKGQTLWQAPIVTEVSSAPVFYPAEICHQNYFRKNPLQGYCTYVVGPKVAKFRKVYQDRLKLTFR